MQYKRLSTLLERPYWKNWTTKYKKAQIGKAHKEEIKITLWKRSKWIQKDTTLIGGWIITTINIGNPNPQFFIRQWALNIRVKTHYKGANLGRFMTCA